jgi:hypothetical protein
MNRLKISSILLIVAASLTQFFGCSSKDKGTTPTQTVVQMSGTVSFPSLTTSELSGVTIGFGNYESSLDASGAFRIQGNGHVVGVAMAYDEQQTPMLMSVCPDPSTDAHLEMDVHSTAITLAFLNPFICITDPNHAQEVIDRLEGLPELTYLEILLAEKLYANPEALGIEDDEIDASLSELGAGLFQLLSRGSSQAAGHGQRRFGRRHTQTGNQSTGNRPRLHNERTEVDLGKWQYLQNNKFVWSLVLLLYAGRHVFCLPEWRSARLDKIRPPVPRFRTQVQHGCRRR